MDYQYTLAGTASFSGIGLHSGVAVNIRLLPAPANTGIVFKRVDLEGFRVEALARNVTRVSYATSLMKKGVLISTTEHLLSALVAWRDQLHLHGRMESPEDQRHGIDQEQS